MIFRTFIVLGKQGSMKMQTGQYEIDACSNIYPGYSRTLYVALAELHARLLCINKPPQKALFTTD